MCTICTQGSTTWWGLSCVQGAVMPYTAALTDEQRAQAEAEQKPAEDGEDG